MKTSKRTVIAGVAIVAALGTGGAVWATAANADSGPDDDRVLSAQERSSAESAVLAAVAGGTILEVEASDDKGVAYEAEVRDPAGQEWDIDLDNTFKVLTKTADTEDDADDNDAEDDD
ncbi:hypothetical protein Ait01nite_056270 [Actinoplanes italicus]|uniref:YpeB-like protein with putative protease inhibitory function n=1 Tax=Actinoplanes italicus TaxID=113567 RepID=A0A2T0JKS5_9ACTN|nr:PepSY domain-containing protein [Actinoplanes italicus]PRX08227.1 YpeB-like protein with putative protease inhibitory function [Actinoplanes italicus]GIE32582.1 hypothetical protein Ait01nite_056270 [Actinoplanes italicus]